MARKTNTYLALSSYKLLLSTIWKKPMTQPEIIEATGLCNSTVSRWLRFLHRKTSDSVNLVYISGWKRTGKAGNWQAIWSAGYLCIDVAKPRPLTQAEYKERYKKKKAAKIVIEQTDKGIIHHVYD